MFHASVPVTAGAFLGSGGWRLAAEAAKKLESGAPTWVSSARACKVGKTSLLLEVARHAASLALPFVLVDVF
ncbi:MAG: hypothetical protein R3F14_03750 [Polyangiaceae bacterium]